YTGSLAPTGGGGMTTDVTVMVALPVLPSLVAVIADVPADTAVTRPLTLTVATAVFVLLQVTTRPVRTLPLGSRAVAVAVVVPPTVRLLVPNATDTVDTGTTETVIVAPPVFPPLVALIVAVPAATPVTTPLAELTVATDVALELQVTTRPVRMLPLASRAVAVAVVEPPTVRLLVPNATDTVDTGTTETVIVAPPVFPSLVALIVAVPTATPVTTPLAASTVATDAALELQVTTRPVRMLPLASRAVA